MKKTPFEKQGEVLKDLNAAELELRQAEDALVEHKHEHAGRDGGG